ncbi:MAG TPA: peptidoglycan-binding protein [Clostridia bacterium]|nr:peptidoglycan-binding protein [Clostridia bacterium]
MQNTPKIPNRITVHLGNPDQKAKSVNVSFVDYIKNVSASETYPIWPENALRANIYSIVSFALNRVYTEHYRGSGYDFDITNSPEHDMKYNEKGLTYQNISRIVDETFNDYVIRSGQNQPLIARYCSETECNCPGLVRQGTVSLALEGKTPYQILQNYFGRDIEIVFNAPLVNDIKIYPGKALKMGDSSPDVEEIQNQLQNISVNYPTIPEIKNVDGAFDSDTLAAVKRFQEIFDLDADGVVGKATWYRLKIIDVDLNR